MKTNGDNINIPTVYSPEISVMEAKNSGDAKTTDEESPTRGAKSGAGSAMNHQDTEKTVLLNKNPTKAASTINSSEPH